MKRRVYENFLNDRIDFGAWTPIENFSINDLSLEASKSLNEINVVEVVFEGGHEKSDSSKAFNEFENFIIKIINKISLPCYLIVIEHKVQQRNRVRSYKGLFKLKIKENFIEEELNFESDRSLMIGIAKIPNSEIFKYIYDNTNCFIYFTSEEILNKRFINENLRKHLIINEVASLSFPSLVVDFCKNDWMILRSAGDGGEREVNLQFFIEKSQTGILLKKL